MNYLPVLRKTLQFIEEHMKDEITLEELSHNAGYSEYHFSRLFKEETGLSVMDYVRRRRLVYALSDIDKGWNMADVAMDYGFDTQGGFIRAFQKIYGSTPGKYCIQVLGKLPNSIQLASIGKRKDSDYMKINSITRLDDFMR